MSKQKKPYIIKSFQTSYKIDQNGKTKDNYFSLFNGLMYSPQFINLPMECKIAYTYIYSLWEYQGKRHKSKDNNYVEVANSILYPIIDTTSHDKTKTILQILVDSGFLDIKELDVDTSKDLSKSKHNPKPKQYRPSDRWYKDPYCLSYTPPRPKKYKNIDQSYKDFWTNTQSPKKQGKEQLNKYSDIND